ncbi:hypothetical protein TRFO_33796 [Tritrichomonas foetus]|uniref:Uncharacterized protein n=1 Tax=Tritrichomonas foetus TaxID=1144522 RepID=A0A1J4JKR7_9EUKA|nr:hypothetical protein [Tritrichomonas foetus]OHS99720.1 hypothetical protein TRFO_33796 [Tritrichomonas foetus]|eukprot:OHS99720.1 hypothetical protein TRFO_33796 [Tritrichomonas foetus]
MSCPFCARPPESDVLTHSVNGNYVPYPYPSLAYEEPIVSGTTDEILRLRGSINNYNNEVTRRAKGIYHWSNVPSGEQIQRDFLNHYPIIAGKKPKPSISEYPYQCTAPCAQPPRPNIALNNAPPPRPVYRPAPVAAPQPQAHPVYRPAGSQQSCGNGCRVQQAIKHIDAATRILKHY